MEKNRLAKAWVVAAVMIFAGVVYSIDYYKVAPVMDLIMTDLGFGESVGGLLITICAMTGLILAFPAGAIMTKTGPRLLGTIGAVCTLLGSIVGGFSTGAELLLITRFLEGVGYGIVAVVAPAFIAAWFPEEKRGLPMSIWACWISFGILIVFNAVNLVVDYSVASTWVNAWWMCDVLLAIALVLYLLFCKMPEVSYGDEDETESATKGQIGSGMKSSSTWFLCIGFMAFAFIVDGIMGFVALYCTDALGMDPDAANSYTSIISIGMFVASIALGFIMDALKKKRAIMIIVAAIAASASAILAFLFPVDMVLPYMVFCGVGLGLFPAVAFTICPDTSVSMASLGVALGIIILGQNLGSTIGPVTIGAVVEATGGYGGAVMVMVVISVICIVSSVLCFIFLRRKQLNQTA